MALAESAGASLGRWRDSAPVLAGAGDRPRRRPARSRTEGRPRGSGPELEALRLAVHHPRQVADRLEMVLFAHPLARACFEVLSAATTLARRHRGRRPPGRGPAPAPGGRGHRRRGRRGDGAPGASGPANALYAGLEAEMRQADPGEQAGLRADRLLAEADPRDAARRGRSDRAAALEAEHGW